MLSGDLCGCMPLGLSGKEPESLLKDRPEALGPPRPTGRGGPPPLRTLVCTGGVAPAAAAAAKARREGLEIVSFSNEN